MSDQENLNSKKLVKSDITCAICNSNFSNNKCLNQHISSVHEKKKPFKCSVCELCFSEKGTLKKKH